MKHSITKKFTAIMIASVAGTVLLCWILNTTLLGSYYVKEKQNRLLEVLTMVQLGVEQDTLYTQQNVLQIERISAKDNMTVMIMNSGNRVLFLSGGNGEENKKQFFEVLFAAQDVKTEVIESADEYTIGRYLDSRLGTEYLILWGNLSDGNLIFMRTPLESIHDSVNIANRFLANIGIVGALIGGIIVFMATRKITRPVQELADLSRRMSNLDFDAKYISRGTRDEIDLLGEHMNGLSETLQKTISELKSANNELQIDIEKKNQIDEMRKEFLSNVSHELKTPLALIQGYAEGLKDGISEDQESREYYCEVIVDEAEKMNRMVKQLLTLNQLEFGNDVVTMERFDITEVIRGVVQATSILQEQNGITVEFAQDEPVYVWADEFKTEEVLTNYMSNAIHHAQGEKKIIVSLHQKGDVVRINVFNTGSQIPQEDLDQIWTKFYKVDKARTREYGGSGIGLSIVKAIMDSFHQKCGVQNLEDGVVFWFELDSKKY